MKLFGGLRRRDHLADHPLFRAGCALGLVHHLLVHQRRAHIARAQGVAGDALLRHLEGHRLREPHHRVLGGRVGRLEGRSHQPVGRRDVDDAPPALGLHARQGRLVVWNTADTLMASICPVLVGEGVHRRHVLDAGVVDQDVRPAEGPAWPRPAPAPPTPRQVGRQVARLGAGLGRQRGPQRLGLRRRPSRAASPAPRPAPSLRHRQGPGQRGRGLFWLKPGSCRVAQRWHDQTRPCIGEITQALYNPHRRGSNWRYRRVAAARTPGIARATRWRYRPRASSRQTQTGWRWTTKVERSVRVDWLISADPALAPMC